MNRRRAFSRKRNTTELRRIEGALKDAQMSLGFLVLATPTSTERDALTEANMLVMTAINKLEAL